MCADVRQHDQIPKNKKTLRNTVIPACGAVALGNPGTQHAIVYAASGAIGQVDGVAAPLIARSPTVPGSVTVAGIMQCAAWAEAE